MALDKMICLIIHYLEVFVVIHLAFDTNGENIDVAVAHNSGYTILSVNVTNPKIH